MNKRNIPKHVKIVLEKAYGRHCGFPKCRHPAVTLHHKRRFAYAKSHDPAVIVPLCKIHHELAHLGLIENEQMPVDKWQLRDLTTRSLQFGVDKKWEKYRRRKV